MKRCTDCMSIANRPQADLQVLCETDVDGTSRLQCWVRQQNALYLFAVPWGRLMSIAIVRKTLLWCPVINYGVLLVWFLFFLLAHDWMYQWHGMWFHLSVEQFDALHYAGMALYKVGILLLNLAPYIALRIVGRADAN